MGILTFFLCLEEPEVDLSRTQHDVVGPFIKVKRVEHIIRPVAELVGDSLDQEVVV